MTLFVEEPEEGDGSPGCWRCECLGMEKEKRDGNEGQRENVKEVVQRLEEVRRGKAEVAPPRKRGKKSKDRGQELERGCGFEGRAVDRLCCYDANWCPQTLFQVHWQKRNAHNPEQSTLFIPTCRHTHDHQYP